MSFFNWFSKKSGRGDSRPPDNIVSLSNARGQAALARVPTRPLAAAKLAPDPANRSETRKARRHARREQLYIAVRESMTRAGVLAASYKFKVLSLDQRGDGFLVMIDVDQTLGRQAEKLVEIESIIVRAAQARSEISVTSVYWRMEAGSGVANIKLAASGMDHTAARQAQDVCNAARQADKKPLAPRYEPIQDEEVAAFKRALTAASASSAVAGDATGKSRSGLHSYTLLTGFEDTEMSESAAVPALSSTQYGDLT